MGVSFVSYFQVFTIIRVQHTLIELLCNYVGQALGGKVVYETPLPEPRPPQKWELPALGTTPLMLHNFIEYINITSHTKYKIKSNTIRGHLTSFIFHHMKFS